MARLTIIRGLPGSGKTTKAHELSRQTGAIIIEPDMFLVQDGKYDWSLERVRAAHEQAKSFLADCAKFKCDVIYCATMSMNRDVYEVAGIYDKYDRDSTIKIISLDCTIETSIKRNTHSVPVDVIKRMAACWEFIPNHE